MNNDHQLYGLLLGITHALVEHPALSRVVMNGSEDGVIFYIEVDQSDIEDFIGKGGRNARAIRIVSAAWGQKCQRKVNLKITTRK